VLAEVDLDHAVARQRVVLERVLLVAGELEVLGLERAGVHDQDPAALQVRQVRAQRRRVHRDQHLGRVARGEDLVGRELELEPGDPRQAARGRPDLGREVREGGDVVAVERRSPRELGAGELHAVSGVAREADDYGIEAFGGPLGALRASVTGPG
jgi:hypothetical protein